MTTPIAPIIKGVSTISWGVDSVATITGVVKQSATAKRKMDKASVKDTLGNTVSRIYYDKSTDLNIKAVYNGATEPTIGTVMTVVPYPGATAETNYILEELDVEFGNTNEVRLTMALAAWDGIPTP